MHGKYGISAGILAEKELGRNKLKAQARALEKKGTAKVLHLKT